MTATSTDRAPRPERVARGVVLCVATFCLCACAFSLFIASTLLWPNAAVNGIWAVKPEARSEFVSLGALAILGLVVLAAVALTIGIGLFRGWAWSRWTAVVLLAGNVVPDVFRAITVDPTIFIPIIPVTAVVLYLTLPVVGRTFHRSTAPLGTGMMEP